MIDETVKSWIGPCVKPGEEGATTFDLTAVADPVYEDGPFDPEPYKTWQSAEQKILGGLWEVRYDMHRFSWDGTAHVQPLVYQTYLLSVRDNIPESNFAAAYWPCTAFTFRNFHDQSSVGLLNLGQVALPDNGLSCATPPDEIGLSVWDYYIDKAGYTVFIFNVGCATCNRSYPVRTTITTASSVYDGFSSRSAYGFSVRARGKRLF